jgi:hypothetical protein
LDEFTDNNGISLWRLLAVILHAAAMLAVLALTRSALKSRISLTGN